MTVLLAADGTNLAHRCWHASGQRADAPELARMVARMVRSGADRVGATHVVVAFDGQDAGAPRRTMYPDYKAGRRETDPRLTAALLELPARVDRHTGLGLPAVRAPHAEADDVLARYATSSGVPTVLLTADRDALALLAYPDVRVLRPQSGGVDAWHLIDAEHLVDYVDVTPDAYGLFVALKGDTSDNIPGVHGIGDTYAARIARELTTTVAFVDDIRAGGPRLRPILGPARTARLVDDADQTIRALELAIALTRPLPVPHLRGLDQLTYNTTSREPDAQLTVGVVDAEPCPHGMPGGDQPDDFVFGRLACPQCALEASRRCA